MATGILPPLPQPSSAGDCGRTHLPAGHFQAAHPVLHTRLPPLHSIPPAPLKPVEKGHPGIEAASASHATPEDAQRCVQRPPPFHSFLKTAFCVCFL